MIRSVPAFALLLFGSVAWADDSETTSKGSSSSPGADWSKYVKHSVVKGTIVKADDNSITLQMPKLEPKKKKGKTSSKKPAVQVGHENVEINYAPNGLVRSPKVPKTDDGKGGKILAGTKELEAAMQPIGAPGYRAEKSDLKPGTIVEVTLVHPSDIQASKVTKGDIVIKYVMIEGEGKAPAATKDAKPKKNN